MKLIENILRFERHLNGALSLRNKNISDYLVYNTLAIECFQAVNSLKEIGEYIVTIKKLGFPSTYGEIFDLLYQNGILTKEKLKVSKRLIFLRNLIANGLWNRRKCTLGNCRFPLNIKSICNKNKGGSLNETLCHNSHTP